MGSHGPVPRDAPTDGADAAASDESTGLTNIDGIAEALAPLVEKHNGLGELLAQLRTDPDNPATVIQLAQNLAAIAPDVPQAALPSIIGVIGAIVSRLGPVIGPLTRLFRRPPPGEQPRELPAPKQRGEEPAPPPAGAPSPISPPRAKPPTVPPPDLLEKNESEERSTEVRGDPFVGRPISGTPTAAHPSNPEINMGSRIRQPFGDVNDGISRATATRPALDEFVQKKIERIDGASYHGSRVKDRDTLEQKIGAKGGAEKIGDYLGARIVVEDPQALQQVIEALQDSGRVLEVDRFLESPRESGYRAVHVQLEADTGISVEIQIQPRPIFEASERTHPIHERYRHREISPAEKPAYDIDMADVQRIYEEAWSVWTSRSGEKNRH